MSTLVQKLWHAFLDRLHHAIIPWESFPKSPVQYPRYRSGREYGRMLGGKYSLASRWRGSALCSKKTTRCNWSPTVTTLELLLCVETVLVEHCPLSARRHEADACWVALQPPALHLSSCIGQFHSALTGCFVSLCIYQQCIAFLALTSGQKKPAMGLQSTITSQLHLRVCTLSKLCWYYISLWPHITSEIFVCSKLFKSRRPQK